MTHGPLVSRLFNIILRTLARVFYVGGLCYDLWAFWVVSIQNQQILFSTQELAWRSPGILESFAGLNSQVPGTLQKHPTRPLTCLAGAPVASPDDPTLEYYSPIAV
jgi:hypothetical protein